MADKDYALNIPLTGQPRVVIVGGGFGGIHMIKSLAKKNFQVVMLDRYNYHTFQPLLYQVATAGLEPDSVAGPLRKVLNKQKNVYFRMLRVESVNPDQKTIHTSAGDLSYDYLVIATGAEINYFGNSNIAKHAFPLKQVTHALDLRSQIFQQFEKLEITEESKKSDGLITFVIVGAGPTGVEVCGALAELKKHVLPHDYPELDIEKVKIYLVEGLEHVLPFMSRKSGNKAQKYLENMGVEIKLKCLIEDYDGKVAKLNNGEEIATDTLVWAAGVKGNLIDGLSEKSIEKGKILVNGYNQVYRNKEDSQKPVYNDIFAIGDVSMMKSENYEKGLPGLAQVAIQQGKQLSKNIVNLHAGEPVKEFHYKNKGVLATIGRNKAVADLPANIHVAGFAGWLLWMVVHILFLVGFRSKAITLANWVWNYFTFERSIRLILRPSTKSKDRVSREMIDEMNEASEQQ